MLSVGIKELKTKLSGYVNKVRGKPLSETVLEERD